MSSFYGDYRKSRYYAIADSIYYFNENFSAFNPGLPASPPSLITEYFLKEVGLIYKRHAWGLLGETREVFLKQINGISIPKLDTNRVKNGSAIGVIKNFERRPLFRKNIDAYEKFILNQYLLGRRFGPEK